MIGLVATLIAAVKCHTGFAIFAGLMSVFNIYAHLYGEADDIWLFGWVLLIIAIFMKTKQPKAETIIINNSPPITDPTPQPPPLEVYETYEPKKTAESSKFCGNCGKPLQLGNKYCPNCGSKVD